MANRDKYKAAGVDVEAGYEAVQLMKAHIDKTLNKYCMSPIGGFGGTFDLDLDDLELKHPVLVSGTDGVGTKLRLAHALDKHDTIGIDCVAMCVNDVICCGAKPLYFLDYIACGKNTPTQIEQIVSGVADGCIQSHCALIGGETAEMPGFYGISEYDIAGFCVGVVDKEKIISTENQIPGDCIIGLESSGVHSNGFSLVRKVFNIDENPDILNKHFDELGSSLGDALLTPTKIYVDAVMSVIERYEIKGIAHITGGGFTENIPRALKSNMQASINLNNCPHMPIFDLIADTGNIENSEMYNTFNMGMGMCFIVSHDDAQDVAVTLAEAGYEPHLIGMLSENEAEERVKFHG